LDLKWLISFFSSSICLKMLVTESFIIFVESGFIQEDTLMCTVFADSYVVFALH